MGEVYITQAEARRIADAIARLEGQVRTLSGTPQRLAVSAPAGIQVVRVTSATPTDDRYPAKVQDFDPSDNSWADLGDCWAVGVNGDTLTTGYYLARRYGEADDGSLVFAVQMATGGGGIEVEEVDGSPSYSSVTELRFDQADGFVVTQPAGGVARVDMAAATGSQAGIVSLSAQVVGAGVKSFGSQSLHFDSLVVGPGASSITTSGIPSVYFQMSGAGSGAYDAVIQINGSAGSPTDMHFRLLSSGGGMSMTPSKLQLDPSNVVANSCFSVDGTDGLSTTFDVSTPTGTLTLIFKGGILTTAV